MQPSSGPLARLAAPLQGRAFRVVFTLAALGAAAWCVVYAWERWGAPATRDPQFLVSADKIEVTPLPPWIRADVVREVVRDGSLENHSVLDPQLTVKVADAFRLHPWVRTVRRVSKRHPARIEVDLEFRKPAALVEVTTATARGVLPVDEEGVLLPRDDFVDAQGQLLAEALKYPVIVAGDSLPQGPAGSAWGDPVVAGGARIAAAFGETWEECNLFKVAPGAAHVASSRSGDIAFELRARNGSRVQWGAAPGDKPKDQALAKEKAAKLTEYAKTSRAFALGAVPVEVSFLQGSDLQVSPR